jgi:hypothetical protein
LGTKRTTNRKYTTLVLRNKVFPGFRRLVAGISLRRPGFDPSSVNVRFLVYKVALGQFSIREFCLSPVSIIPAMFHAHVQPHVPFIRRTKGEVWEFSKNHCALENHGSVDRVLMRNFCSHLSYLH